MTDPLLDHAAICTKIPHDAQVKELRSEPAALKEVVAELTLENRLLNICFHVRTC